MTYRELFYKATRLLDNDKITLGEYEEMTKPLDREVDQEPCDKYIKEIDHLRKYIYKLETQIVEQEPILDKVKQAREEIENLNLNDYGDNLYQFQAKCTGILDKLIESEG